MLCMGQVYVVGEVGIIEELELKGIQHLGGPEDVDKKIELKPGFALPHDESVRCSSPVQALIQCQIIMLSFTIAVLPSLKLSCYTCHALLQNKICDRDIQLRCDCPQCLSHPALFALDCTSACPVPQFTQCCYHGDWNFAA